LNKSFFTDSHGSKRQGIAHDYFRKRRHMLVAIFAIGIDDSDIFDHAVVIDDVACGATQHGGKFAIEYVASYSLLLKAFPSTAVQHTRFGKIEFDSSAFQGLYELRPHHVGKTVDQDFAVAPFLCAGE
jgi:hypothetical protein